MWQHKLTALQKEETAMNKKLYLDCTSGISGGPAGEEIRDRLLRF